MFEVAERFYMGLIPQARNLASRAGGVQGRNVNRVIDDILARPEHAWFKEGAAEQTEQIRRQMEERYGQGGKNPGRN